MSSLPPKDGKQVFASKKYNDFGNTFVNPLFNYATGGFLDLPSDVNKVGSHHMVPVDEMAEWRDRCEGKVTQTATVEMHFSGKDIMLTTREPKLSFAGALGNIGTYSVGFDFGVCGSKVHSALWIRLRKLLHAPRGNILITAQEPKKTPKNLFISQYQIYLL